MPLTRLGTLLDITVGVANPVGATPAGSRVVAPAPFRGWLMEAGFSPQNSVTSAMTLAVAVGNNLLSSAASNFVNCITSTLGTFSSTNLYEGALASCIPPNPTYVNAGDAIQFTTSGGDTSAKGVTCWAVIRKG